MDAPALADFFAALADAPYFHPHDFDAEAARRIAAYQGSDVYLVGLRDGRVLTYGMLRGWDEGYDIPSLGIAVRPGQRGNGLGRAMMVALHEVARTRGTETVRLRVHPENVVAHKLYVSLGYQEAGPERGETLMLLDLSALSN